MKKFRPMFILHKVAEETPVSQAEKIRLLIEERGGPVDRPDSPSKSEEQVLAENAFVNGAKTARFFLEEQAAIEEHAKREIALLNQLVTGLRSELSARMDELVEVNARLAVLEKTSQSRTIGKAA